mmetsp:Transcript_6501/g.9863  ORF Transcript_6501/g.9863 Transcript_6501/m.9863 type:complete len:632 (-) Transcript_6501:205-2100(-)
MKIVIRLFLPLAAFVGVANASRLTHTVDGERRNVLFSSRRLDESYCQPDCVAPTPSPVEELTTPAPVSPRPTLPPVTPGPTPGPTPNPTPGPTPNPTPGPTPQPVNEECPYFLLDFAELTAGTYIYDELVASRGVKITAKKTGSQGYTPINGVHVNSGGGAMVFDTSKPTGDTGQSLCDGDDGDPDLGAPNTACPGGGPGHGSGGAPTLSGGAVNPYSNCEPQGNVLIIQESNKSCPDDTGDGGELLFEFTEATDVNFATLLDVDFSENTPEFYLTYGDGSTSSKIDTTGTGDNGLFKKSLGASNVKKVKLVFHGSGSISELSYRFCPPEGVSPVLPTLAPVAEEVLASSTEYIIDFENGMQDFTTTGGSDSTKCKIISDSRCGGTKSASCQGTHTDVSMQMNAPDSAYEMTYQFSISHEIETADRMNLIVGGTIVHALASESAIASSGAQCFERTVSVNPKDVIKFDVRTSANNESLDIHYVKFSLLIDDFEADMCSWSTYGTGSNGWRRNMFPGGNGCTGGSYAAIAGPQTGSNSVTMKKLVPNGVNRMEIVHKLPGAVFETSDILWVKIDGVKVKEFEDDSSIQASGTGGGCATETYTVVPGKWVEFVCKTSFVDEFWEIDQIKFYKA